MVIMDMDIKFLSWDIYVPKILGGGINPNNSPYVRLWYKYSELKKRVRPLEVALKQIS